MPCSFALLLWTGLSACSGGGSETAGKPDDPVPPITDTSGDSAPEDSDTAGEGCNPTVVVGTRLEVREDCFVGTITDTYTDTMIVGGSGPASSLTAWAGAFVADSDKHIIWSPAPIDRVLPSSLGGIEISEQYGYSLVNDPIWTVGDFDGDGSPDAAMIDSLNSVLYAYRHPFEDQDDPIRWDWTCADCEFGKAITAGDCDGDGVEEIVANFGLPAGYDVRRDPGTYSWDSAIWRVDAEGSSFRGPGTVPVDLDGDGIDDLVSGEWRENDGNTNRMLAFFGPLAGVVSSESADTVIDLPGESPETYVPVAGDVDGDGAVDLVQGMGGDTAWDQDSDVRSIYVMSAPPPGYVSMEESAFAVLTVEDANELGNWGEDVAAADMDEDGFAEVVTFGYGASDEDVGGCQVFLFAGPLAGEYTPEDATGRISDAASYSGFGRALAIGDVSSTAGSELLVSAKVADVDGEARNGAVYIIPVFW